jgi:hypothetical protein
MAIISTPPTGIVVVITSMFPGLSARWPPRQLAAWWNASARALSWSRAAE